MNSTMRAPSLRWWTIVFSTACTISSLVPEALGASSLPRTIAWVEHGQPKRIRNEWQTMRSVDGFLECTGRHHPVYADGILAGDDFHVTADLRIDKLDGSGAGFSINRHAHFVFDGPHGQLMIEGRFFVGRNPSRPLAPNREFFRAGQQFRFEMIRRGPELSFLLDGKLVHRMEFTGEELGMIGFRPQQGAISIRNLSTTGVVRPLLPRQKEPDYTIPVVDLSNETQRQVTLAPGTAEVYQGHPTTLLMPDGKTMFAVWTYDHGGQCGPLKRSDDAGLTWSDLLPVPDNWRTIRNCPALHRLIDPRGRVRLFVFAGNGDMYQAVPEDRGSTWSPMKKNGLRTVVAPITIVPISQGRKYLAHYHAPERPGARLAIWQSVSSDGGLTWEPGRVVATFPEADPCEPALIRSPDGRQLISVMRENTRRFHSLLIVSNDEGVTWSSPVELPASLTGDRHMPRYAPDGRLVITFRDMAPRTPTRGDFVAWIGRYEDIVQGREGQYRVHLLKHYGYDSGYGGLEHLPDGTMVATTYCAMSPGIMPSIVSVRFTLAELDRKAAALAADRPSAGGSR